MVVRIEDERDLLLTVRDDGGGLMRRKSPSAPAATCPSCKSAPSAWRRADHWPAAPYGTQVVVRLAQRDRLSA